MSSPPEYTRPFFGMWTFTLWIPKQISILSLKGFWSTVMTGVFLDAESL